MIAISVLTVAVGGSFALIQQTLVAASLNQSKLVASYLVQEGIEIARNIRDNNWLEQRTPNVSWDEGLTICQPPTNCCEGDYKTDLSNRDCNNLRYLNIDGSGFYSYFEGTPTNFKRKINITEINTHALEISVEVQWQERGRTHHVEAIDYLYNWYGY